MWGHGFATGRAAASATKGERGLAGALTAAPFLLYG